MSNLFNINFYKYYIKLSKLLKHYNYKEIVFFCVGNYKVWYDSFASLFCKEVKNTNTRCFIYGGKDFPILPDNLTCYIEFVKQKHPNACVIVVDNLLTLEPTESEELIINNRSTNIAGLATNLTFGNISVLYKTYPYQNSDIFLEKQYKQIKIVASVFQFLINNGEIV